MKNEKYLKRKETKRNRNRYQRPRLSLDIHFKLLTR